jgi:ADP-ribosylglycohydrolase
VALPADYTERVYAGVLGKIIGVYLGRPFENWTHERIERELGEIRFYVNGHPALEPHKRAAPIVQTDDDISGTFTFLRALPDHGNTRDVTPAQIGRTWLNYVVEERSTHWWGGVGVSTEHSAYVRLADGLRPPETGSAALGGRVLSEQIGAQIFVDGWAMVAPGDPELAAELARRAASVSHDGEAVHAARAVAAMEALAFVEPDRDRLLDTAVSLIPDGCTIARVIQDVRDWHAGEPDWRRTRRRIEASYGYHRYGGGVHVVPNHALIVHALLHGDDDFTRSLTIVNTSGWDTDCNAGNLGCLLGIKNGLAGLDAGPDWRGPVADRMYLSSADGGRAITDALTEAIHVADIGRALAGEPRRRPKDGARFGFALPGSVQGFQPYGPATVGNEERDAGGRRALAIRLGPADAGRVAGALTATFTPPEAMALTDEGLLAAPWLHPGAYALLASPTLYPGQVVRARVEAGTDTAGPVTCALVARVYDGRDELAGERGPEARLEPGGAGLLEWRVPDTGGQPVAQVGIEVCSDGPLRGTVYLDRLTWGGPPDVTLTRPVAGGAMWRRAWVPAVDRFDPHWPDPYHLTQNRGRGLLIQGAREWDDYEVSAPVRMGMARAAGIAARVQGLRRYYALLLCDDGVARLVKALDGDTVVAEAAFRCEYGAVHELALRVEGTAIEALVDGAGLLAFEDGRRPLDGGAAAFVCEAGTMTSDRLLIRPRRTAPP